MTTTTTTQLYRHHTLPITAPVPYWTALGYTVYSNTDVVGGNHTLSAKDIEEAILIGLEETGANDHRPLVWAMKEVQRRQEAKTQSTAIADRFTTALQNAPQFARRSAAYHSDT